MTTSRKKFVLLFLLTAFIFQFVSNSLLGSEIRLFPADGVWFPGTQSTIAWKSTLVTIIYPIKLVLLGPLPSFFNDPDGPPPILVLAFAIYWGAIAVVLHLLFGIIKSRKKNG